LRPDSLAQRAGLRIPAVRCCLHQPRVHPLLPGAPGLALPCLRMCSARHAPPTACRCRLRCRHHMAALFFGSLCCNAHRDVPPGLLRLPACSPASCAQDHLPLELLSRWATFWRLTGAESLCVTAIGFRVSNAPPSPAPHYLPPRSALYRPTCGASACRPGRVIAPDPDPRRVLQTPRPTAPPAPRQVARPGGFARAGVYPPPLCAHRAQNEPAAPSAACRRACSCTWCCS